MPSQLADEDWVQKSWLSPLWSALEDYECEAPYDGPLPQVSDLTTLPFTWEKSAAIQRAAVPSVVISGPKEAGEGRGTRCGLLGSSGRRVGLWGLGLGRWCTRF